MKLGAKTGIGESHVVSANGGRRIVTSHEGIADYAPVGCIAVSKA
jgi:hypothetical protein